MIVGAVPLQLMVANVTVFSIHPVVKTPLPPGLVPQMPLAYVATCVFGRTQELRNCWHFWNEIDLVINNTIRVRVNAGKQ